MKWKSICGQIPIQNKNLLLRTNYREKQEDFRTLSLEYEKLVSLGNYSQCYKLYRRSSEHRAGLSWRNTTAPRDVCCQTQENPASSKACMVFQCHRGRNYMEVGLSLFNELYALHHWANKLHKIQCSGICIWLNSAETGHVPDECHH